jgi:hypothetical protein
LSINFIDICIGDNNLEGSTGQDELMLEQQMDIDGCFEFSISSFINEILISIFDEH